MNMTNNLCLKYHNIINIYQISYVSNILKYHNIENMILHKQKKKRFKNLITMHNIFMRNFLGSILRINSY